MSNLSHIFNLLSVSQDAKTVKGEKMGYLTGILYMAPSDLSGVINICPNASPGCRAACLWTSGKGAFPTVQAARIRRTVLYKSDKAGFIKQLESDIVVLRALAHSRDFLPACRLNGTGDLPVETWGICEKFPDVAMYDYTKSPRRMRDYLAGKFPSNYHLTFSRSETNETHAKKIVALGGNVAVVFSGKELPKTFWGRKVISGDESDLRFKDEKGVIVGLTAKGKAKKEDSGFVVDMAKEGV